MPLAGEGVAGSAISIKIYVTMHILQARFLFHGFVGGAGLFQLGVFPTRSQFLADLDRVVCYLVGVVQERGSSSTHCS